MFRIWQLIILAVLAFAKRGALAVNSPASTVLCVTRLVTGTPILVDHVTLKNKAFGGERVIIDLFSFRNNEFSQVFILGIVLAAQTLTRRPTITQVFETRAMKSQAMRVLAFTGFLFFLIDRSYFRLF